MRLTIYRRVFRWIPNEPARWFITQQAAYNFGKADDWHAPEKFIVTLSRAGLVKFLNRLEKDREA